MGEGEIAVVAEEAPCASLLNAYPGLVSPNAAATSSGAGVEAGAGAHSTSRATPANDAGGVGGATVAPNVKCAGDEPAALNSKGTDGGVEAGAGEDADAPKMKGAGVEAGAGANSGVISSGFAVVVSSVFSCTLTTSDVLLQHPMRLVGVVRQSSPIGFRTLRNGGRNSIRR